MSLNYKLEEFVMVGMGEMREMWFGYAHQPGDEGDVACFSNVLYETLRARAAYPQNLPLGWEMGENLLTPAF
ncbi:hypothetical protein WDZ92_12945 [Nostoc sp. NIES-2111]